MDEDRRKLMDAWDQEITRIGGGGYERWLGTAAATVVSTVTACKKLQELAEQQGRPFEQKIKAQLAFLEWYGQLASMTGSLMETLGAVIQSKRSDLLPFALLESLGWMWVAAHRVAYALWRDREETRLLWKDVPTSVN